MTPHQRSRDRPIASPETVARVMEHKMAERFVGSQRASEGYSRPHHLSAIP